MRIPGERLDVERLGELPVDPVANTPQERQVAQVLGRGRSASHLSDRGKFGRSPTGYRLKLAVALA